MLPATCVSLHRPTRPTGAAVLVLAGSSGALAVADRRRTHGLDPTVVTEPGAGHRVVLPGERPVRRGHAMARGGTPAADAARGRAAWPHLCRVLGLRAEGVR